MKLTAYVTHNSNIVANMINWYLIVSYSLIGVIAYIAGYMAAAQKYREKCDNEITARICELYRRDKENEKSTERSR